MKNTLSLDRIYQAAFALKDAARKTDLIYSPHFSGKNQVYFKTENLQVTGSFKLRGAYFKISRLSDEEKAAGIVACSAGNHAQGVAYAASKYGVKLGRYYGFANNLSFVDMCKQMIWRLYAKIKYPSYSELIKELDADYRKEGMRKGNYVYCCQTHLRNIWDKDDFGEGIGLLFEGHEFNAPMNYDAILKSLYGNYWQLPAESERMAPHDFLAYWK